VKSSIVNQQYELKGREVWGFTLLTLIGGVGGVNLFFAVKKRRREKSGGVLISKLTYHPD
jgi:hypothetical protein